MTNPKPSNTSTRCLLALIPILAFSSCGDDVIVTPQPGPTPVGPTPAVQNPIEQAAGSLTIDWDNGEVESGTVISRYNSATNMATLQFPDFTLTGVGSEPPMQLQGSDGVNLYRMSFDGVAGDVSYGKVQTIENGQVVRRGVWRTQ